MTREDLISWATSKGWTLDGFGHLHKKRGDGELTHYRIKLSKISARYEVKSKFGWVRMRSGYLKALSINNDGKIVGMTL
jgi:hypothetical protein